LTFLCDIALSSKYFFLYLYMHFSFIFFSEFSIKIFMNKSFSRYSGILFFWSLKFFCSYSCLSILIFLSLWSKFCDLYKVCYWPDRKYVLYSLLIFSPIQFSTFIFSSISSPSLFILRSLAKKLALNTVFICLLVQISFCSQNLRYTPLKTCF